MNQEITLGLRAAGKFETKGLLGNVIAQLVEAITAVRKVPTKKTALL